MKYKLIFGLLLFCAAIGGTFWGLSQWSLHRGVVAADLLEFSASNSWPVRYKGLYKNIITGEEKEFTVFDENLVAEMEEFVGQQVALEVETHFLSVWNNHGHSVRGLRALELGQLQPSSLEKDDALCRLVHVIRRSRPMVEVLRERIHERDPELLKMVRGCPQ